jgi:uncharacterized surface protein with fasciclin (FAS1) repeats
MTRKLFSILRYTAVLALVASLFVISGCDDDEDAPTKTIYELISEDATLSKIKAEIDLNADLKAKLSGAGDFTFFAPNDLAMSAILTTLGLTDFTSISPSTLSLVLNYHLATKAYYDADLVAAATIATNQGENITVEVTTTGQKKLKTGATTNGTVITADIKATNGVLHIVGDYPLVPPTIGGLIVATLGKVAQPILLSASFSTLASAILKADAGKPSAQTIVGAMVGLTACTFFAPPNQVFQAASITADTYSAAQWDAIIRGHILPKTIATLGAASEVTINGKTLTITGATTAAPLGSVKGLGNTNAIPVAAAKVTTSNGVIYPIGGVILNP